MGLIIAASAAQPTEEGLVLLIRGDPGGPGERAEPHCTARTPSFVGGALCADCHEEESAACADRTNAPAAQAAAHRASRVCRVTIASYAPFRSRECASPGGTETRATMGERVMPTTLNPRPAATTPGARVQQAQKAPTKRAPSPAEVLKSLVVDPAMGLSSAEARSSLE